ncbi:unnamed protein product [Arctia plantaginis]|uniref:Uncharacterized protein n=1 Tax=Arctia plantaginis TaxID=874455 RepID=A0A8S0Z5A7_ARCPL|nr:unnamed protein product [Arctia plantaginis]CAB3228264.1 unnamed protein product [Arctia plantaginis]
MRGTIMPLPLLRRCCYCLPLKPGCLVLSVVSTLACVANLTVGLWNLPRHKERDPEDNLISMSMVIFSSLCAVSNIVTSISIKRKNLSCLQTSIVFNSVFILCMFLVAVVTCIFRLGTFLERPENVVIIVIALLVGALYSFYYLTLINSLYRMMKMVYGESETLVISCVPSNTHSHNIPRPSFDNNSAV